MNQSQMTHKSSNKAANNTSKNGAPGIVISISCGKSNEIEMHKPRPQPTRQHKPMCHFFIQGRCNRGQACRFNHQVQRPTPPPTVEKVHCTSSKTQFPALCKQSSSANTHTGTEYKNMASVPALTVPQRQPWVKTKGMVVIYRQVKDGKFTGLV